MILTTIDKALTLAKARNWTKIYWAIDIHGTIFPSTWNETVDFTFYPFAKETLQLLSERTDCILIVYTSTHSSKLLEYIDFFGKNKIYFQYANSNPEVKSDSYGKYSEKFYFNILLDDKAGFAPITDWKIIFDKMSNTQSLGN